MFSSSDPIASGTGWSNSIDISNEAKWFTALAPTVSRRSCIVQVPTLKSDSAQLGNIFQGAVYLSWGTQTLVNSIGSAALSTIKTISRHSYPQSACGGASTNLTKLMSHS